ncbi:MAG TPA: hypothetical protein VKS82_05220 [Streptosporangiaceae bacterium]|nr:hypothetical protein [Streptosporangiaceae bacterium]
MLKRIGAIMMAGGAAAALSFTLGATSSSATTARMTWTVKPGGAVTGKAGKTTLRDTKTGTTLTCASSATKAKLKSGSGLSNPLGKITSVTFSNCTGPGGLVFTAKTSASSSNPWPLSGSSFSSGVTKGKITNIKASISGTGCSAKVAGTTASTPGKVTGTYSNSTGKLKVSGGNLHVWKVNGCFGLIHSGDPSSFTGTYTITPKQTIS